MADYKPDGYTDLSPYLVVSDAQATLDFVKAVFGTEPLRIHRHPSGDIMHAEAKVGDSVLMIGQMEGGHAAMLHVYVPDPDAAMERALAAGATLIEAMTDQDDGDRRGGVIAPCGTMWYFARGG